jgi:hypothetical protein
MVEDHWDGILAWHRSRITNGLLEGKQKMITIVYLLAGKLPKPSLSAAHTM